LPCAQAAHAPGLSIVADAVPSAHNVHAGALIAANVPPSHT
jgi:hypothetical protein